MQRFRRREFEKREGLRPAEFGKALLLIVGSIFAIAFSENSGWLRVLALVLEGGALLFILQTSDAHRRFLQATQIAVVLSVAVASAWTHSATGFALAKESKASCRRSTS